MKKLWFFLAMFVCVLASCSDGGSDDPSNPTPKPEEVKTEITLDNGIVTNGLSFGVAQGEQSVSFTTNTNWTLSIAATTGGSTWCKASATSGSKGTANVKFTVTENTDYDDRSVSVTIKAGTASKTFTITQKGADALLVTTKKYEVAQAGGKIEVEVKANIEYQLAISETAKDWIKETQSKSRALTTKKHTFQIAENEEVEKREGEITIKSGDKVETVKVYQAGGAVLLLSKNEFTVSDAGETITVDIKSNVEYGVQMPDVDWIKDEASNRGMSSHTLKYVIAPNEGYDSRSAEIIFYDQNSDLKDTLKVIQAQKDAIVISKKEYEVEAEGETIEVKLSANVDFEVTMPEVDWIEQVSSRALKEHTLYFKVAKHEGEESRTANIVFINKRTQLNDSIVIKQTIKQGYTNGVVIIKKAGTLKELMGNDYLKITSLKIIGSINGSDIRLLRQMLGASEFDTSEQGLLTTLDLSEAHIEKGGEWYYSQGTYDVEYYYTSDNVIGKFMFYECENLKCIKLPNNITLIGESAFSGCALSSVYITDLSAWCKINFENANSNPLCYKDIMDSGKELYLNNNLVTELTIPNDVIEIKNYTFIGCKSITKVNIPNGVISIGNHAFGYCRSLTNVTIGNDVTSIGEHAFWWCLSLKNVTIGKKVTSIGYSAFYNCESLINIDIPNSVSSIDEWAFYSCESLETLVIPNSVVTIGEEAFRYCESLKKVVIGDGITSISDAIFANCKSLSVVTIGKGVKEIGHAVFNGCAIIEFCCHANTPPTLHFKGLDGIDKNGKLFVPTGCSEAYKKSRWTNYFKEIIELKK